MKFKAILIVALSVVLFLVGYREMKPISDEQKMENMIAAVEKNDAKVEKWSWLARETKTISNIHTFQKLLNDVKDKANIQKWELEQSPDGYKATSYKKFSSYEERVVVTWSKENTKENTFIIFEVSGAKWDPKYIQKTNKIFSEKPIIYTCVQGVLNDKIEGVLQNKTNQVLKDLSARAIEQIEERAFVSVSAYNKKWDDALSTNREKINVQIAIRSTDNKDTIVVGTPIITSEY
ncbi:YwmB family TATA-box binding protein [Bacillus paranthracis]|uniref:YwmB family TATA-box binding protein n=1 Tax=Bacillus cereus group TaxID=86661 RepID=UPI0022E6A505|nr:MULTISPECIES: YwmB family TATA-box binding protein [Bacillus cereus group]MDA1891095.1 YwmB family TATA-box binding protein [Bacillus cereus group sp. BY11-1LC]MDA2592481.1 YwmB family TATA-box binding protein [Bacillus cereus group sp. Bc065]MDK7441934.1 YwmB family TATA-box binding protein [Bacillus paranthracis]MDK7458309.1 YwmB family TATA-box binding protein [Bacillus paranthracis]